jgi:hypothetical protein
MSLVMGSPPHAESISANGIASRRERADPSGGLNARVTAARTRVRRASAESRGLRTESDVPRGDREQLVDRSLIVGVRAVLACEHVTTGRDGKVGG